MKYQWKAGAHVKVKPTVAHNFFERVRKANNGVLDLDEAVRQSKPKNAPLHGELEWSDKVCGQKYRREQMRYIVRKLEVIRDDMPQVAVREYESIEIEAAEDSPEEKPKRVFMRTEELLADPARRADLLSQAVRDALAFRKRYAALSELATLIEVIDQEVSKLA